MLPSAMADDNKTGDQEGIDRVDAHSPAKPEKRCSAREECDDRRGDVGPGAQSWEHIPELVTPLEL